MKSTKKTNNTKITLAIVGTLFLLTGCGGSDDSPPATIANASKIENLGKQLYFDENLSEPIGISCASCHEPGSGFASPDHTIPVSRGSVSDRFGSRNAPTAAYTKYVPEFHFDADKQSYVGGLFLDGSAKNLVEQAKGPLLNPLEMALPDKQAVIEKVKVAEYAPLFKETFGDNALDNTEDAFNNIAKAIAAFGSTSALNRFNSKYDYFLKGEAQLKPKESRGLALFTGKAKCSNCHTMDNTVATNDENHPLFTDFTYDNIGVPANPSNPFYSIDSAFNPAGADFVDLGLGKHINKSEENGKFRVPTLRNIAVSSPYMHNGVFASLRDVISFYNSIGTLTEPTPEVAQNVNRSELKNLNLSTSEMDDLEAFLKTLTDNYKTTGKDQK